MRLYRSAAVGRNIRDCPVYDFSAFAKKLFCLKAYVIWRSKLYHDGYMEAVSYEQTKVFEAAVKFAKCETILPAPESAHAIKGAI